jgi:repressor LexA
MANLLGDRIKKMRKRAGLTQVELAEKLGIAYPTLNKYERGHRTPDAALLNRVAKLLGCNPGWLLSGERTDIDAQPVSNEVPTASTPVLNRIPDSFPEHVQEETAEYISLPGIPAGSYSFIVKGESMSPAIRENDYVIFKPVDEVKSGDIVLVNNEWGESILRRYCRKNSKTYLVSDNPEYPSAMHNKSYKIIGKVIAVWRKIKI